MDKKLVSRDAHLDSLVHDTRSKITSWAAERGFRHVPTYRSYIEHHSPSEFQESPAVTIMLCDEDLAEALYSDDETEESFSGMLAASGLWFERWSGHAYEIYPDEGTTIWNQLIEYNRWEWICGLLKPDFDDVYEELYSFFNEDQSRINSLGWRGFEILLQRIMTAQGFEAHLGPGSNDGGVDVWAIQRDPLGDMLTVVQAKRYRPDRKIGQTDVAALHGVATVEKAQKGLFVTTSSYLPVARKFAARTNNKLELATSEDVLKWCSDANHGIIQDKSKILGISGNRHAINAAIRDKSRIVHSSWGIGLSINSFALILKETKHAALLMPLDNRVLSDDGYGQRGTEIPDIGENAFSTTRNGRMFRVSRQVQENGEAWYWGQNKYYSQWSGQPEAFDLYD
jgi:hypothetical protein